MTAPEKVRKKDKSYNRDKREFLKTLFYSAISIAAIYIASKIGIVDGTIARKNTSSIFEEGNKKGKIRIGDDGSLIVG